MERAIPILKPLTQAPSMSPLFVFKDAFTKTSFARSIIDNLGQFSRKGEKIGCIWFGSTKVAVATHPETVKEVLTQPEVFRKMARMNMVPLNPISRMYESEDGEVATDMATANGCTWSEQRKHFKPSFASSEIEKLIPTFWTEASLFSEKCRNEKDLIMVEATSNYTLDCLGSALLGQSFGAQNGDFKHLYDTYTRVMQGFGDPLNNMVPVIFDIPLQRNKDYGEAVDTLKAFFDSAYQKVKKERAENPSKASVSILDAIVDASEHCTGFPKEAIIPNLFVFFAAGHDSTASSIAWAVNALAAHPEIQNQARDEIIGALGEGIENPTMQQIDDLEFLDALLKETLRLNPPIHNIMTREAVEDTQLGGYAIPKGTGISIGVEAVNTHVDSWENPFEFNPSRHLGQQKRNHKLYSWMPFSVGPRRCIGQKFSMTAQKTLLMKLLLDYDIKPGKETTPNSTVLPLSNGAFSFLFKKPSEFSLDFVPRK